MIIYLKAGRTSLQWRVVTLQPAALVPIRFVSPWNPTIASITVLNITAWEKVDGSTAATIVLVSHNDIDIGDTDNKYRIHS